MIEQTPSHMFTYFEKVIAEKLKNVDLDPVQQRSVIQIQIST